MQGEMDRDREGDREGVRALRRTLLAQLGSSQHDIYNEDEEEKLRGKDRTGQDSTALLCLMAYIFISYVCPVHHIMQQQTYSR
jgi:hypothetical protein